MKLFVFFFIALAAVLALVGAQVDYHPRGETQDRVARSTGDTAPGQYGGGGGYNKGGGYGGGYGGYKGK